MSGGGNEEAGSELEIDAKLDPIHRIAGDLSVALRIDLVINERVSAPRPPRIRKSLSRDQAIRLGRLALDKAVTAAELARAGAPPKPEQFAAWADLKARADAVVASLDKLFSEVERLPGHPELAGVIAQARSVEDGLGVRENISGSSDIAASLRLARSGAEDFGKALGKIVESLPARQNPGDPTATAFVAVLADAWVMLTGLPPGAGNLPEKNPFLRFATAAWSDWHGPDAPEPAFVGALRASIERLTPHAVSQIATSGAAWLG